MSFFIVTSFITAFTSVFLGIIVYLKNKKSLVNKLFGFYAITVFIWSFSYVIWLLQDNPVSALFWSRMLNMGAAMIPIAYLHWVLVFLKKDKEKKSILIFGYILTFIFVLFSFSNSYVKEVTPISIFPYWPQAGWLYYIYLVFNYVGMVFYGSYLLYRGIRANTGFYKEQIRYAFAGSVIGFIGGATNFPLMLGINLFPPMGNPLVIAYPICFAYAIIRHRLMDIKFVLRKSYVYLVSFSSILILTAAVKYILDLYFPDISSQADFIILILAILAFPAIKDYFYRLGNKYFFSSLYDSREVIAEISDKLRTTLEARRIYDFIYESLNNALHFKAFGILGYNAKGGYYLAQYNKGFNLGGQKKFLENEELHKIFISQNEAMVIEEIKRSHYNRKTKETIDMLEKLEVDILVPLNVKDKTIGLIALGPKESGDMYNDEDLRVLKVVSAQAAIAIENALLYEETLNFTVKLKKEVAKATEDLRIANEELKKLDQAKSDFISIASHQLRTPLTVIKGYISMMLEGNFGQLTGEEKKSLEKVYDSGERLIRLVENLLNISRIESGRLQFNYEVMPLEEIVESVVEELANAAKKKGLRLNYERGEKPLPKIKIDEEKIRQVVMNLTDNAIKYTKKGSITVSLKKVGENIRFCVSDSGLGISKEDLPNLFKKFSRGEGTSTIHTEGTGLGLYVAKEMVEAHQGKIWAESKGRGRGNKFCFEIPIK